MHPGLVGGIATCSPMHPEKHMTILQGLVHCFNHGITALNIGERLRLEQYCWFAGILYHRPENAVRSLAKEDRKSELTVQTA
jgi:hypothetical protein